jgi:hypothetical protein
VTCFVSIADRIARESVMRFLCPDLKNILTVLAMYEKEG